MFIVTMFVIWQTYLGAVCQPGLNYKWIFRTFADAIALIQYVHTSVAGKERSEDIQTPLPFIYQ